MLIEHDIFQEKQRKLCPVDILKTLFPIDRKVKTVLEREREGANWTTGDIKMWEGRSLSSTIIWEQNNIILLSIVCGSTDFTKSLKVISLFWVFNQSEHHSGSK